MNAATVLDEAIDRKAFDMRYSAREIREKTLDLWLTSNICEHCLETIASPDQATALHRNRDDWWLLVHSRPCSLDAVSEENRRLRELEQEVTGTAS